MLSVAFQLTPAQTTMLLAIAFDDREGSSWLPNCPHARDFITPMRALMRRGFITHDSDRAPSYVATELGLALAKSIAHECKSVAAMADGADKRRAEFEKVWKLSNERRLSKLARGARP